MEPSGPSWSAHPHVRGVHKDELLFPNTGAGPSPRAWGSA
ncbi:hypothetical protein B005_4420 [Nocardiopsis alba ATCC BAA-2165]|uniref:Uncharacterized protein n=1 Tax=Nocardiopsis alba (strain ATCC BAA-2165 / BE74) TaxID=1205910 RepID=J7LA45_NOCAA|nr:hypothetical protein B005_4420 [Nocardiopsis alba ATCC BAA-2165]